MGLIVGQAILQRDHLIGSRVSFSPALDRYLAEILADVLLLAPSSRAFVWQRQSEQEA